MRKYYYDVLRVFACFLVIVNHTISVVLSNYTTNFNLGVSLFMFYACKMAIPIFLMLSGALLLSKKQEFDKNYLKRIFRLLILALGMSFIVYFIIYRNFNIFAFMKMFIEKELSLPYWYLYMIIGVYILIPFIQKMVSKFNTKDFIIFFTIGMIYNGILPIFSIFDIITINPQFSLPIMTYSIWWLVIGYWFDKELINKKFKYKNIISIIGIIIPLLIVSLITYVYYKKTGMMNLLDNSALIFIAIPSLFVFYLISNTFRDINKKIGALLQVISSATLGIYVLHPLLLDKAFSLYEVICNYMNQIISIFLIEILIFIICFIITFIIKRIPLVKNIF